MLLLILKSGAVLTSAARLYFSTSHEPSSSSSSSSSSLASLSPLYPVLLLALTPYIAAQLIMGALAVLCRDWRGTGRPCCLLAPTAGCARWLVGFLCVGALGTYKT